MQAIAQGRSAPIRVPGAFGPCSGPSGNGHLPFVLVRHRTHRWATSVALVTALGACAQASAATPQGVPAVVAGVQVERQSAVAETRAADVPVADVAAALAAPVAVTPGAGTWFEPPSGPLARRAGDRALASSINGLNRHWTVVVPPGTTEDQRLPLLVVLHGVGGTGTAMRRLGFEKYAATTGMLVAYPDAMNGSWNDGRPGMEPLAGSPVDDIAFLRELIVRSTAEVGADATRVSIAGFSNGALMASRAACDMTDQLQSVVLVAGSGPRDMTQKCKPSRPLPMMVVFGTGDATVPYEGGQVAMYAGKPRGLVAPVREVLDIWRAANGCAVPDSQEIVSSKPAVTAFRGKGCRADLVHFRVAGGGHEWLSAPTFDTTGEAWRFVNSHS